MPPRRAATPFYFLISTTNKRRRPAIWNSCSPGPPTPLSSAKHPGNRAGLVLLARAPDAVLVPNCLMTVGFLRAAGEKGKHRREACPLVSVGDDPWVGWRRRRPAPRELPKYELGDSAVRLLLDRVASQ